MGEAPHTAGGALSKGKLQLANADASDVLSGKKFYAGDKVMKTGTFDLGTANAGVYDVLSGKSFYAGDKTLKYGAARITWLGSGSGSQNFSATSIGNFRNLSADNFFVVVSGISIDGISRYRNWGFTRASGGSLSISKSYDAGSGNLWVGVSISYPTVTWDDGANVHTDNQGVGISYNVYFAP